jgi:hypothetical protein
LIEAVAVKAVVRSWLPVEAGHDEVSTSVVSLWLRPVEVEDFGWWRQGKEMGILSLPQPERNERLVV